MAVIFVLLEAVDPLALEFTLITLEPLHVDTVDVRSVLLENVVPLAFEVTLVTVEPLHVDAVDASFVPLEVAVLLALVPVGAPSDAAPVPASSSLLLLLLLLLGFPSLSAPPPLFL